MIRMISFAVSPDATSVSSTTSVPDTMSDPVTTPAAMSDSSTAADILVGVQTTNGSTPRMTVVPLVMIISGVAARILI